METNNPGEARPGRKQWLIIGVIAVFLTLSIILIWQIFAQKESAGNLKSEQISELEKRTPPTDPMQRAVFYGQLGQVYLDRGQIDKALDNFLIAQNILHDNNLESQYTFNQSIADIYKTKGDAQKEKVYLEDQRKFLQQLLQSGREDGGAIAEGIKAIDDRLKAL